MSPMSVDVLRNRLLFDVRCLERQQVGDIPEEIVASYVAHEWFSWRGDALHLTERGEAVVDALELR